MNIVQIRSPFIIEVNEASQVASKIELFIWNYGDTVPTIPNYVMSKYIPSATQKATYYNVSNFLSEFIENINTTKVTDVENEEYKSWCLFKIKRYYNDGTYKLLDTIQYVGLNGFTEYTDGMQNANVTNVKLLTKNAIKKNYKLGSDYGYFNLLVDSTEKDFEIKYNSGQYIYGIPSNEIQMYKVPYSNFDINQSLPCTIDIYNITDDYIENTLYSFPVEECKYVPVECSFINYRGGWEFLTFYKAQSNSINVKSSEYDLLPNKVDYDVYKGQSKAFNINGTKSIKLNTGWVEENYNDLIHDLLLSETILLDNKPAKVKNKSFEYKTDLKDKNINFEIEFEYAFNLINDVV